MMQTILLVLLATAVLRGSQQGQTGTRWIFELRDSSAHSTRKLPGTLELRGASISANRASGDFILGEGSLGATLTPLVPDGCITAVGTAELSRRHDSLVVNFSPNAHDCGLVARGVVRSDTVSGMWYQPAFSGYKAQGPFVMWRQR